MDRSAAYRKWQTLRRMTVARGCTVPEAATAARLAATLAGRWGFTGGPERPGFASAYDRAEQRAARRWQWEYRKCGKPRCWCSRAAAGRGHGPYRYVKHRTGATVHSVYLARW